VRHPVHSAICEREQPHYNICVIELEEQDGLRLCGNVLLVAPDDSNVGLPVRASFAPATDNPDVVLPVFQPAAE
jgi:uncharacterized OB-fold protein